MKNYWLDRKKMRKVEALMDDCMIIYVMRTDSGDSRIKNNARRVVAIRKALKK
jgi:hypothetical protein